MFYEITVNRLETHRGFIETLLADRERFEALLVAAYRADVVNGAAFQKWRASGRTRNECMFCLLDVLRKGAPAVSDYEDLGRLREILVRSCAIRQKLTSAELWRAVFSHAGLSLGENVSVEPVSPPGRRNFTYRVRGSRGRYVVRYHDPIGREFLQRNEPRLSVHIYCVMERLTGICLGRDRVVATLFPALQTSNWSGERVVNEDRDSAVDVVLNRILIQPDYSEDYFLLSEYVPQNLRADQAVELIVRCHAELHSASRGLQERSAAPTQTDELARSFAPHRSLLRFTTAHQYGAWIAGSNWVSRRILASLRSGPAPVGIWPCLLNRLGYSGAEFMERSRDLWKQSEEAMERAGSLVHFDMNPRNCFVDRRSRERIRLFDFEYLAILDPAYDLGLGIDSVTRLALRKERGSAEQLIRLLTRFCEVYIQSYQTADSADAGRIVKRGLFLGGLTLAATLNDEVLAGSPDVLTSEQSVLLRVCEYLLV